MKTRQWLTIGVMCCFLSHMPVSLAHHVEESSPNSTMLPTQQSSTANLATKIRHFAGNFAQSIPPWIKQRMLQAEVSIECSLGLLKTLRGLSNLEPWTLRRILPSWGSLTAAYAFPSGYRAASTKEQVQPDNSDISSAIYADDNTIESKIASVGHTEKNVPKSHTYSRETPFSYQARTIARKFRATGLPTHPLIDSSGKVPGNLFIGSVSELGSFDECLATVVRDESGRELVRAQYCSLYVRPESDSSIIDLFKPALLMTHPKKELTLFYFRRGHGRKMKNTWSGLPRAANSAWHAWCSELPQQRHQ
ncbi:hypothetical protein HPB51_004729 [Rhipicephalus microplus]|uniref:Nose resistant-to-fluoxetine protein N-terminal domain-containing protein n=1 Tax=Rhipicephalus microplus TaxID=6941 RepID=A0A9J6EFQ7_RHIMP|nr:hypothetical protein HPB51_004729 [Rhipicephalus microplus]